MDKTFRRTLRVKLLIVIVLGLVIAILTFFGGMFLLDRYVSSVYMSSDHTSRRSAKQIQSFDWMIQKMGAYKYIITNSDTGEVIILIQDSSGTIRKIRRSDKDGSTTSDTENSGKNYSTGDVEYDYNFYPVLFKDGVFDVCIVDYSDETVKSAGEIAVFVLCCIMFVAIIIVYFSRETHRMRILTNEVMYIKDVDVNGPITIHGQDEICMLAQNIDTMRQTIIEQLSREREAWQANSGESRAASHHVGQDVQILLCIFQGK